MLPALALLFAIRQFTIEQEASRRQVVRAATADSIANERLFMRSVLDLHFSTYMEAANAAGTLAGSADEAERRKATDAFRKLYWGPMVMFEADAVTQRMIAIGHCIDQVPRCSDAELKDASLRLASALKLEYLSVSNLSPARYADRGHDYTPARPKP